MDRRAFLTSVASGWMVQAVGEPKGIPGQIVGASHAVGHQLRDGASTDVRAELPVERADVVIVGSGVSGLSAAWRLRDAALDVRVLELEPFIGGTSTWGDEGAAPHPWGAHYIAAPNVEARVTLRLLAEMGVVVGWDAAGRPEFDPRILCHAPQERLFYRGEWWPGLVPHEGLTSAEAAELARFTGLVRELKERVGGDGRPAFQIPVEQSSRDPALLALDRESIASFIARLGFETPFLRWYVRYAMLDDFGGEPSDISAWAGLHYFAARKLRTPQLEGSRFLVWPEGNGRLVRGLMSRSAATIRSRTLALAVSPLAQRVDVRYVDVDSGTHGRIEARAVVLATPGFVTARLYPPALDRIRMRASSPWVVSNLHVKWPIDPDRSWDSVLYDAEGLGYVDAHHQLTTLSDRTVVTYYRAYGALDVAATRAELVAASWEQLADGVIRDLYPAHPELRDELERLDVMVWGHGMPRPRPGFLGASPFEVSCALAERIVWAHVDQSGMALFEEAQLRGVRAAETVAAAVGVDLGESWL